MPTPAEIALRRKVKAAHRELFGGGALVSSWTTGQTVAVVRDPGNDCVTFWRVLTNHLSFVRLVSAR